jgi:CRP-like cAMP-binding protein
LPTRAERVGLADARHRRIHLPVTQNRLIEALPRAHRRRLLGISECVELKLEEVLWRQGEAVRHVYFPLAAFISLIASLDGKPALEVGMAGHEGMLGAQLALGVTAAPLHAIVQGSGNAWRVSAAAFRRELRRSTALQRSLHRYLNVLMYQFGTSAACVRYHEIGPRLARWLLMTHDRAGLDTFHVTHEFLSYMLGVRRVGITAAAGGLQRKGLISYTRGELSVLDRQGLERAACSCYAADLASYAQMNRR